MDIDTRSSGAGSPTHKFLESFDFDESFVEYLLKREGFIRITSDDGGTADTKTDLPISGYAYAPIIAYEVEDILFQTVDKKEKIYIPHIPITLIVPIKNIN